MEMMLLGVLAIIVYIAWELRKKALIKEQKAIDSASIGYEIDAM